MQTNDNRFHLNWLTGLTIDKTHADRCSCELVYAFIRKRGITN